MLITTKKGKGDKIHIYADDEYRLTVDESFWFSLAISEKSDIDEETFAELENGIMKRRAFNKAVELLACREHCRREIVRKLTERGYSRETAEETADKLSEYGYLDDERFARLYAKELKERKKYGAARIKQELMRKGIERDTVETVMCDIGDEPETEIRLLLLKKYPNFARSEKDTNRAINALLRYGYRIRDIKNVMNLFDNDDQEYYDISEKETEEMLWKNTQ